MSEDDLSLLRIQWPVTVLRRMVWLQNELDATRAAAKKRYRNSRREIARTVASGLSVICTAMCPHLTWITWI